LGVLGVGHEISEALASEVSRVASSEIAFFYGDKLIVSTLPQGQQPDLAQTISNTPDLSSSAPMDVRLAGETFLVGTVQLAPSIAPFVRLSVLKSYDKSAVFLDTLNSRLLALGFLAVLAGSGAVFLVSYTFTKPLANLVSGVRALESGDFGFRLATRSRDELAELTAAFDRMRNSLQRTQKELLAAERLATIGLTASSISHDLRHPLTAIVANAEFLCDKSLNASQREELYGEIRTAVDQMTNLVDSLLEFSLARDSLRRVFGGVEETVKHARHTVQAHPDFHHTRISISREGRCETWFDPQRVERALVNLLRNACEFVPADSGKVDVNLRESNDRVEIRIIDNGPGVPEAIRGKLFQPFVTFGKQNGVGLGLAIGQKIFQDHGGDVCLESTEPGRTVFRLTLPLLISEDN
jgi:signal transduction histidine kinase